MKIFKNSSTYINTILFFLVFAVIFIYTIFLGSVASDNYFRSFTSYMKKDGVSELKYDNSTNILEIKRNGIKLITKKEFKLISQIKQNDNDQYFFLFLKDDFFNKNLNALTQGDILKKELSELKVLFNKMEDLEITNKIKLEEYYGKLYPYNVNTCDFNYEVSLFEKSLNCQVETNIMLHINSVNKTYELVIDNYSDWDLIFKNYIDFNSNKIFDKIKEYKETSLTYNNKSFFDNSGIVKIIDKNNIIYKDGSIKKTTKDINTEMLILRESNKEYIENIEDKSILYLKYKTIKSLDNDLDYIKEQLSK